jgi:uncharacterized protein HemY
VTEFGDLDRLSTKELHDMAFRRAEKHLDLAFFWHLLEYLPAAEAAGGRLDKAEADVATARARLDDLTDAGSGTVAEALRPVYIDYLAKHSESN